MASLPGLPQELRDIILAMVILSPASIQPTSEVSSNFTRKPLPCGMNIINQEVLIPTDDVAFTQPCAPLLLTSKKIREQTILELKRLGRKQAMKHEMEVLILNEKFWLPTWIRMPWTLPVVIPEVILTFRAHGPDLWKDPYFSGFLEKSWSFSAMREAIQDFLLWFFVEGVSQEARPQAVAAKPQSVTARLKSAEPLCCCQCKIAVLRLEVASPLLGENEVLSPAGVPINIFNPWSGEFSDKKPVVHPDPLAEWIAGEAEFLFFPEFLQSQEWNPIGKIVVTRMGRQLACFEHGSFELFPIFVGHALGNKVYNYVPTRGRNRRPNFSNAPLLYRAGSPGYPAQQTPDLCDCFVV
ncbi:hypothetical protein P171DRAFT_449958 [Karstenula rhodostoma CBS 690.94]|uniref:Uncharacterized protein n=1 Tax=Karstenula rhodostoma CBS 690.94 TaxID=1392251 RepID=A0A9P4P304_9PLEO|nr:hypothetical protein P171DRAFT_449958 [Karstenula rhodostoma CBS 690.94]